MGVRVFTMSWAVPKLVERYLSTAAKASSSILLVSRAYSGFFSAKLENSFSRVAISASYWAGAARTISTMLLISWGTISMITAITTSTAITSASTLASPRAVPGFMALERSFSSVRDSGVTR